MNNAGKTSPVDGPADSTQPGVTLFPPQLPPFLSAVFNLQPIIGTPKPDEIKLIHAAIRTVNSLSQTPEMRDSDLPIELSQYLFDVQIACYREKYPVNIFPNDIVYTPPELPTHIPVTLNQVVGPPQDKDLKSVHSALRITESFANVASLFDPDMHMGLSQHLFDLQLARRIQRSSILQPLPEGLQRRISARTNIPDSSETEASVEGRGTGTSSADTSGTLRRDGVLTATGTKNGESQESASSLAQVQETLQDIKKIMVASQNSLARGFNSSYQTASTGYSLGAHSVINEKGEMPEMHGLPTVKGNSYIHSSFATTLQVEELARYLQFYGIGGELVEDGEIVRIRPGMEENARQLLKQRIGVH